MTHSAILKLVLSATVLVWGWYSFDLLDIILLSYRVHTAITLWLNLSAVLGLPRDAFKCRAPYCDCTSSVCPSVCLWRWWIRTT